MLELTEERKAIIQSTYDEYMTYGLSTEPADFGAAEKAITELYVSIGKSKPHFVRLSSPLGAEIYINLLTQTWPETYNRDQLRDQLGDQLWDQLWDQLRDQLWGQLGNQLWNQLGDQLGNQLGGQLGDQLGDQLWDQLEGQLGNQFWSQLGDQLWDQLRDQLEGQLGNQLEGQLGNQFWDQLGDQLWDQLRDQLRDQLGNQLRDQLWDQLWNQLGGSKLRFMGTWFYGQWDYYWVYLDGMRRVGAKLDDPKLASQLDNHLTIMKSIGWFYPFDDFVVITDRPELIKRDDDGRLHSEHGPALKYRDGYELHSLDGVRVPPEWTAGKFPTSAEILNLTNPEQRAVACKYVGWHNMLEGLNAKLVDEDEDPLIGSLFRFNFETEEQRIARGCLVYLCATGRIMSSLVSPKFKTALAANAWMQGLDSHKLREMETRA